MKLHRIFSLFLRLLGAVTSGGLHASLTPERFYQKVLPSVVTWEVQNQRGESFVRRAVLAVPDDLALMAWHVVADERSVWAVFADRHRVKVIGCIDDGLRDSALLKLEESRPNDRRAQRLRF